jgi:hypothetical protein
MRRASIDVSVAVFESTSRLPGQIASLLEGIRLEAEGRYACLLDDRQMLCEAPPGAPPGELAGLARDLVARATSLFEIPGQMEDGADMEDLFAPWPEQEFLLAFVNRRVVMVLACPEPAPLQERLLPALRALADLLFRYEPRYRLDEKGRGLFLGRGRIDTVVVGGQTREPDSSGLLR